jgi:hypothetical protein
MPVSRTAPLSHRRRASATARAVASMSCRIRQVSHGSHINSYLFLVFFILSIVYIYILLPGGRALPRPHLSLTLRCKAEPVLNYSWKTVHEKRHDDRGDGQPLALSASPAMQKYCTILESVWTVAACTAPARAHHIQGRLVEAAQCYERAPSADPTNAAIRALLNRRRSA